MGLRGPVGIHFTDCVDPRSREMVREALLTHDILGAEDSPEPAEVALLVLRSSVEPAVAWLRSERDGSHERRLVVALEANKLTSDQVFRLLAAGAVDVLSWDALCAERVAARLERWAAIDALLDSPPVKESLVGGSRAWRCALRQVAEVAAFSDAPLLIMGETGTGKELVARLVHELDPRRDKRNFVVLDCTTIVSSLSGSEFFGHEKGAFTGAAAARNGAFALASDGTLFLDEVGELPLDLQAELLRVVQEQTYKRVGGSTWQSTRFRLVCATNRDLEGEREAGRFRSDLLYRLAGWTLRLPPLRERREDVLPLVEHFLAQHLSNPPLLDEVVREYFLRRPFPGNVRELRQLVARVAHRHVGPGAISIGDLGSDATSGLAIEDSDWCDNSFQNAIGRAVAEGVGLKEIGRVAEDIAVKLAVCRENGSLQNAARRLGVTDRALQLRRASQRPPEIKSA